MFSLRRLFLTLLFLFSQPVLADVEQHFNHIKNDPKALYAFFKAMPKGGELHYHLAGGAYPEAMLAVAADDNFCFDKTTFIASRTQNACEGLKSNTLQNDKKAYNHLINAWSMRNFKEGTESNKEHFFNSFFKFMPVVVDHRAELLTEVLKRAASQNEQYMEIMILPDNGQSLAFAPENFSLKTMARARNQLLANKAFQRNVLQTIENTAALRADSQRLLNCKTNAQTKACQMRVGFQYYLLRQQPPASLFAQALNGFEAANRSKDIVAINIVQPEDDPSVLRDYSAQMKIIEFMHQHYPKVHISLHAGELTPDTLKKDKHSQSHIYEAIHTGHAERIGHGVSIAFEKKAGRLLQIMQEKPVPVEINLTSNEIILHIKGRQHPLTTYIKHQVPVVLSTDDEGVLRTDLTTQYVKAATEHHLDYATIKQINRNALTYSFLPGKSLWQNAGKAIPVKACHHLNAPSCLKFTQHSAKATQQRRLELRLIKFEHAFISGAFDKPQRVGGS